MNRERLLELEKAMLTLDERLWNPRFYVSGRLEGVGIVGDVAARCAEVWPEYWSIGLDGKRYTLMYLGEEPVLTCNVLMDFFELSFADVDKIFNIVEDKPTRTIGDAINDIWSVLYAK